MASSDIFLFSLLLIHSHIRLDIVRDDGLSLSFTETWELKVITPSTYIERTHFI